LRASIRAVEQAYAKLITAGRASEIRGDIVSLQPRASKNTLVAASVESVKGRGVPKWLELDAANMKGKVLSLPARDDVNFPIQEQLIVELYSK